MANKVKIFSTKFDPKGLEDSVNQWIAQNKDKKIISVTPSPSGDSQTGFIYSITIYYSDPYQYERASERVETKAPVDFTVNKELYRGMVQNVSEHGAFIKTPIEFEPGQEITMIFELPGSDRPYKVTGKIAQRSQGGIGTQFKRGNQVQEDMYKLMVEKLKQRRKLD